jgi:hypothetical protein
VVRDVTAGEHTAPREEEMTKTQPFRGLPAAFACLVLAAASTSAQSPTLLVSTTADEDHLFGSVTDGEIVRHVPGWPLRSAWPEATLSLMLGPGGSGDLHLVPGDVDALHDPGDGTPGGGLYFSLATNQGGWLDGDVLRVGPDGLEVAWSEQTLVAALGVVDGGLDVDALLVEPEGVLLSLAENEDSSLLSGDVPGEIHDGDVLGFDPGTGAVWHVLTESQVGDLVSAALGAATSPGDLKGLARDPADGELLFCVQSPSAHDGSVFRSAMGGSLLPGHEELDFGFQGSGELDALGVAVSEWPSLVPSTLQPAAGTSVSFQTEGAQPGEPCVLLLALGHVPAWFDMAGYGGLVLEQDALFDVSLKAFPSLAAFADGMGTVSWGFDVPTVLQPEDIVAQSFSLVPPYAASNPILVEAGQ